MVKLLDRSIYLASRSPRRRELLGHIGVKFHLLLFRNRPGAAPDVDEAPLAGENPRDYVMRVARDKAAAGWKRMLERSLPFVLDNLARDRVPTRGEVAALFEKR